MGIQDLLPKDIRTVGFQAKINYTFTNTKFEPYNMASWCYYLIIQNSPSTWPPFVKAVIFERALHQDLLIFRENIS